MKTLLKSLGLATALLLSISAPVRASTLNLRTANNGFFNLQVDHQTFSIPDRTYSVRELSSGYHYIRVFLPAGPGAHGFQHTREIFEGNVFIPENAVVNAVVSNHNAFSIESVLPLFSGPQCYQQHEEFHPSFNPVSACVAPVSPEAFYRMKQMLQSQNFESTRLAIANQFLSQNHFSSDQVAELLQVFTFDSTRLEFAKSAYGRTIDKQNYYLTYSAFTFESNITDLSRYIQQYS